jgi:predicted transcriptional regulator
MVNEKTSVELDPHLVTRIVSSYVKHNLVGAAELPGLIGSVHQCLRALGKPPPPPEIRTPAVPVRRSVQPEYVVCLECGYRARMLRRHLRTEHGLDRAAYFARWNLPADHPITAPKYSAQRSAVAKQLGLGRGRQAANRQPRRRRRPV